VPLVISILLAGLASVAAQVETAWTWAGLEILGNHHVARSEIEKLIPIPIGEAYHRGNAPFWSEGCARVLRQFDFASVDCGDRPLRVYDGHKAYLIVDIVERGREDLLKLRKPPSGSVPFGSGRMLELNAELETRTTKAAMAGHGYSESGDRGYLSYSDPNGVNEDLSPLVEELARLVPQYRENLLEILRREKSADRRREAAILLNWAGGDLEELLRRTIPLLDDPDDGVRNNLSRFMIQFVGQVNSGRLRRRLIDVFIDEIGRPSHGDRNKGLYNLLFIAKAWPVERVQMRRRGGEAIRYLAENSILFNVQGPAQELLALIEGKRQGFFGDPPVPQPQGGHPLSKTILQRPSGSHENGASGPSKNPLQPAATATLPRRSGCSRRGWS
jgi:hypothetical protein